MKVLHVVPWYEPAWAAGGTATAVSTLCRNLVVQGIDVTVYATNDAGGGAYLDMPLEQPIRLGGVEVWYFPCGFYTGWKAAAYSRPLIRKLSETIANFDLIHISSTRHWHGFQVYQLAKSQGKPYIISPHGSLMKWCMHKIGNKYLKFLYSYLIDARVIKHARALHYLCEGEREESSDYSYGRPSFIVPNGILLSQFEANIEARVRMRRQHDIPHDALLLIFLGRIHPQKNIHLVIEALDKLQATSAGRLKLFVVGPVADSKYYQSLKAMVFDRGLGTSVRFHPAVSRTEVRAWYSMADLFVLPSEVEAISMSVIEALACSLPVLISNRVANYREIQEDGAGMVIEPSAQSIASALALLLSRPELCRQLAENARKSAESRYSADKVASLMIKAYENILSGKRDSELKWL